MRLEYLIFLQSIYQQTDHEGRLAFKMMSDQQSADNVLVNEVWKLAVSEQEPGVRTF